MFKMLGYDVHYGPGAFRSERGEIPSERQIREMVERFQRSRGMLDPNTDRVISVKEVGYKLANQDERTMNEGPTLHLFVCVPETESAQIELLDELMRFELFTSGHLGKEVNLYSRSIDGEFLPAPV